MAGFRTHLCDTSGIIPALQTPSRLAEDLLNETPHSPARSRPISPAFYLLPILLTPILLIVAALCIVPTQWLQMRSGNIYLANLGYAAGLYGRDCQILIYGDSGAMVGLDPHILERRTGFTACNIAEFQGMTMVNQTLPLDIFLAHNPAPRFLIFLYAPSHFSIQSSWADINTFEAISFRLQQRPGILTALLLARHPNETMAWVEGGLRLALTRLRAQPFPPEAAHNRDATDGQLLIPRAVNLTACDPRIYTVAPDPSWIDHLRTRYASPSTTVLVDAIPTAGCNPNNVWDAEHLQGLVDNAPVPHLPIRAYTAEGVEHTNLWGSGLLSNLIADQLAARITEQRGR